VQLTFGGVTAYVTIINTDSGDLSITETVLDNLYSGKPNSQPLGSSLDTVQIEEVSTIYCA
jgi:hypothetical protein